MTESNNRAVTNDVVDNSTVSAVTFASLNLAPEILKALDEFGYKTPTPIQAQAIPLALAGKDLMAGAQTGTGKTAAFALPTLQKLLPFASTSTSPAKHPIRALILTPTRELAIQVEESFKVYAQHIPIKSLVVFGGVDIRTQIPHLKTGVEILVATPGRLLDHVEQKTLNLSQVQMLVLDEADRMLDMGFMPDLKRILVLLPKKRQNLMFSATFSNEIKKLSEEFLTNPTLIEVARSNATAENVTQTVHMVAQSDKPALLSQILRESVTNQVIVFTKTKVAASRLSRALQKEGVLADAIHGDKSQKERMDALEAFKQGSITALIATDVAARGLDIDQLPMVINYEIPSAPEDYVHRIGRTGRAGASGIAISLVSPDEEKYLAEIEKLIKRTITRATFILPDKLLKNSRNNVEKTANSTNISFNKGSNKPYHSAKKQNIVSDPWFDQPYLPSSAAELSAPMNQKPSATSRILKSKKTVAILLSGFKNS